MANNACRFGGRTLAHCIPLCDPTLGLLYLPRATAPAAYACLIPLVLHVYILTLGFNLGRYDIQPAACTLLAVASAAIRIACLLCCHLRRIFCATCLFSSAAVCSLAACIVAFGSQRTPVERAVRCSARAERRRGGIERSASAWCNPRCSAASVHLLQISVRT